MYRFAMLLAFGAMLPVIGFNRYDVFSEKAQIRQICEEQVEAWRLQNYEQEAQVWAHVPYAMKMLTNGTRTVGWKKISQQYQEAFPMDGKEFEPDFSTELSDFYIHVEGKHAWAVFDQHQIFPKPDDVSNELYETLEVRCLEKINGEWRIVFQLTGPYDQVQEQMDFSQIKR